MKDIRDKVLEAVEEGLLSKDEVILMLLKAMSTDDVEDTLRLNDIELD